MKFKGKLPQLNADKLSDKDIEGLLDIKAIIKGESISKEDAKCYKRDCLVNPVIHDGTKYEINPELGEEIFKELNRIIVARCEGDLEDYYNAIMASLSMKLSKEDKINFLREKPSELQKELSVIDLDSDLILGNNERFKKNKIQYIIKSTDVLNMHLTKTTYGEYEFYFLFKKWIDSSQIDFISDWESDYTLNKVTKFCNNELNKLQSKESDETKKSQLTGSQRYILFEKIILLNPTVWFRFTDNEKSKLLSLLIDRSDRNIRDYIKNSGLKEHEMPKQTIEDIKIVDKKFDSIIN